ncbi:MAG: alpha/beta hydrolase [Candidatus Aminicenantes bacterium]|nr:alpha/beta hydrolase [Candidatus Aminicenantes bacterium]
MDTKRATPKYYKDAPPHLYAKLLEFRKEHHIKRFEFNGKTVEYIAAGKGEKTLLMFHGAFGSADTPYNEILRLKDRFRVITPTIRDFGSLDEISNAVNEILRREKVGRIMVRGGSFGAFIAQSFFKRNYKIVDKMVLINAIPPKGRYTKKDRRQVRLFTLLLKVVPEKLAKKIMLKKLSKLGEQNHPLSKEQQDEIDFLMMQVHERLAKVRKRHILESLMLVVDFDLNENIKPDDFLDWKGKILLVTDTDDPSYKYFDKLKAQFPDPQIKVFEKAGHLLQIVYKSEFEKIHDDFLSC